ncbi:MAG: LytTR family DNA-binding domain-containing protein [Myxococcales bacterium]
MTRLRALIVDDEKPARDNLARLLSQDVRFELVGQAVDGGDALVQIERLVPDLVLLDIQLPGLNGFEVLRALGERDFAVVFSTAHDEYALRAFDAHAVDYLLKPYAAERFRRALDKAAAALASKQRANHDELIRSALAHARPKLAFKERGGNWVSFAPEEVLWVAAYKKHTRVVLRQCEYVVRASLRELEQRLDEAFARTHRSEIVNLRAVLRVEPWTHGDAILVLDGGATRVLTRTYRKDFLAALAGR